MPNKKVKSKTGKSVYNRRQRYPKKRPQEEKNEILEKKINNKPPREYLKYARYLATGVGGLYLANVSLELLHLRARDQFFVLEILLWDIL